MCPQEDIQRLQRLIVDWCTLAVETLSGPAGAALSQVRVCRAEAGMVFAKQMLLYTPCDLFPWIKGRTLWLVGDSIQQVTLLYLCLQPQHQLDDASTSGAH